MAGITLCSQGKVAYEGDTLHLYSPRPAMPMKTFFSAIRSTFARYYANYRWVLDNRPLTSRIGFSYFLRPGSHKVSLEVIDKYRRRATASAAIIVENGPDLSDKGPFIPTNVQQFGADGITPLAYHDITDQNIVYLGVRVLNPDGEPVKLQAELREMVDYFTGEANYESPYFVESGEEAFIAMPGLMPGAYKWALRAIDLRGSYSPWLCPDPYNAALNLAP